MSDQSEGKAVFGAIRGLLFMRVQEIATATALARSAVIFVATFGLLMLFQREPSEAVEQFLAMVTGIFVMKFLPIYCLTKGGETLRGELKEGTIEYLWVRPASKVELYVGFVLSGLLGAFSVLGPALLGISCAGLALGAIGWGGLITVWVTVLAVVASFMAISGALGSLSSKFVVMGIFYYAFVELGLGAIPNGVQRLAVSFHAKTLLSGLGSEGASLEWGAFAWILGIGGLALVLGSAIFSKSRYVVGGEKEA